MSETRLDAVAAKVIELTQILETLRGELRALRDRVFELERGARERAQ
jgi:hypothetical protein